MNLCFIKPICERRYYNKAPGAVNAAYFLTINKVEEVISVSLFLQNATRYLCALKLSHRKMMSENLFTTAVKKGE